MWRPPRLVHDILTSAETALVVVMYSLKTSHSSMFFGTSSPLWVGACKISSINQSTSLGLSLSLSSSPSLSLFLPPSLFLSLPIYLFLSLLPLSLAVSSSPNHISFFFSLSLQKIHNHSSFPYFFAPLSTLQGKN